jgi:hypothetical protein
VKLKLETNLRLWIAIVALGAFAAAAVISTRHLWLPERAIADHVASSAKRLKQIEAMMPARSSPDFRYSPDLLSPLPMGRYPAEEPTQPGSLDSNPPDSDSMYSMPNYLPRIMNPAAYQNNSLLVLALPELKDSIKSDSPPSFRSLPVATSNDLKLPFQLLLPSASGGLVSTGDSLTLGAPIGGLPSVPAAAAGAGSLLGGKR